MLQLKHVENYIFHYAVNVYRKLCDYLHILCKHKLQQLLDVTIVENEDG